MEQYRDSQYDDDLTIGTDEYDDSFQTSDIDLFEFGSDGETTISRLKTLVLSIDWEITDEVLEQFQEELTDLKDVWRDDKINMVYLQALEKIGKYISREKADAHPNSIRLLLSMYYNLERIVLSTDLESGEKKRILLEDVRRFEKLKGLIGKQQPKAEVIPEEEEPAVIDIGAGNIEELHALKAIVLGIDWEITDGDLLALREEVSRLEDFYADSKPKQVFLQGIGTVGTYIRKMKSNAHADAFRLLHSFYEGLETLVSSPNLTLEEETAILKPEVKKFNAFKTLIATTLAKGAPRDLGEDEEEGEGPDYDGSAPVAPAFADMPEDSTHGFLEEVEAKSLPTAAPIDVDSHIDRFFGDADEAEAAPAIPAAVQAGDAMTSEVEQASEAFFGDEGGEAPTPSVDREIALQGVDVETEADDDSDEEALPVLGGEVAPALVEEGVSETAEFAAPATEEPKEIVEELSEEIIDKLDSFFGLDTADTGPEEGEAQQPAFDIPAEVALQGVDVEHPDDVIEDEEGAAFAEVVAGADLGEEKDVEPAAAPEEEAEQVAALSEIEEPEESVPPLAAALADVDLEEVEEPVAEEAMDEEEVEGRFDELFASLPDEEQEPAADLADDAMVEEEVAAFFNLDENPEELPGAEPVAAQEENLFDQEILGVREEEPVDFEIGEEEAAALAAEPLAGADAEEAEPEIVLPLPADDTFGELRGCVQSVAVELNDDILQGLFAEIGSLQEQFADKPLEKSFLQLITTVTRHIDQYRYEASDTSLGLLNGLMDELVEASAMETGPAQQVLFTSMSRVLEWQQEQLARKAALQPAPEEQPEVAETPVEETVRAGLEEMMEAEIEAVDIAGRVHEEEGDRKVTDIIRREIEALRETLKQEIADLRKNLRGDQ